MYILGLSFFYHDSAAALIRDGAVVAAGEEERFSRVKHDHGFPLKAIEFCLAHEGITVQDLDFVVFYEKPFVKFERILLSTFKTFPKSWKVFRESMLTWLTDKLWVKSLLQEKLGVPAKKILFADHHMSHAAASYFCSPFAESAILTVDGAGEWTTSTMGVGRGNRIDIKQEMRFPHSIGLLYSAFTAFCGFEVNEGEYKLMGMAPYGKPRYVDKIKEIVRIGDDGSLWHDMRYFAYHYSAESTISPKFIEKFGEPRDPARADVHMDTYYADMAASIQVVTEEILIKMARHLHELTGSENLCMAGGVALNCVANYKILQQTPFKRIYIQPAAGDDGGAVGAAMWAWNHLLGHEKRFVMEHAYLGSEYGDAEVADWLRRKGVHYEEVNDEERCLDHCVERITGGQVIGWYSGRFEWGPRALGSRSIVADARRAEMKDIVNAKIKFREAFRPFAPSCLMEKVPEYFDLPDAAGQYPTRFMLYVTQVISDKIPAITHIDGSGRLQGVIREHNPRYHRLIEKFGEATGVACVLNTSFNLKGEPIVETPENAFNTFMKSGMDALIYNNRFVVTKNGK
ncbi:MAG: carbamoyltransferase [Planctomycetes bacterium]|nr:carbamoyltransferase [Planctomycetota bacterium]